MTSAASAWRLRADERREVPQDARDLVPFGDFGFAQSVGVVDRGEWFDEERLTRAGRVVDDARYLAARRCLQCQHGPAGAFRDEVVLQVLGERRITGDLAEPFGEPAAALSKLAAEPAELRRGGVEQIRSVLLDGSVDFVCDREERRVDPTRDVAQRRSIVSRRKRPQGADAGAHRQPDLPQRSRVEGAAAGGELRGLGHVRDVAQVRLGRGLEQSDRLRRLLLALVDEPGIA